MASPSQHACIVGAGVIGMLTALQLRQRGWGVTVIDRGMAGAESSWAGGGILSPILPWHYPDPIWQLSRRSIALYGALAAELAQATGVDPEHTLSGSVMFDTSAAARDWCRQNDLPLQPWRGRFHAQGALHDGFLLPWVGQIRNPRLGHALALRLPQCGIRLVQQEPVTGWLRQGDRMTGVRTARQDYPADCVVLAAGAWSAQLEARLPVAPVRGQMLLLDAGLGRLREIVIDKGRYLIPRRDGRVLVGSSVEHVGFDKGTTPPVREQLQGFAAHWLGSATASRVEAHWSGLRPGSADELPLIGAHPRLRGLFVNTGHYRNGLVMAPASAELLADLLTGQSPQLPPDPYRLMEDRLTA